MKELDFGKDFEFLRLAAMGVMEYEDKGWRAKSREMGGILQRLQRIEPVLSSTRLRGEVRKLIKELDERYEFEEGLKRGDAKRLQHLVELIGEDRKSSRLGLDEINSKILKELIADFRVPEREIARKLGISPSTVNYRLKRMRKWIKFLPLADLRRFMKVPAIFEISTLKGEDQKIADELSSDFRIHRVLLCTGKSEVFVEGIFDDLLEIREFERKASALRGVSKIQTSIILDERKEKGQLSTMVD